MVQGGLGSGSAEAFYPGDYCLLLTALVLTAYCLALSSVIVGASGGWGAEMDHQEACDIHDRIPRETHVVRKREQKWKDEKMEFFNANHHSLCHDCTSRNPFNQTRLELSLSELSYDPVAQGNQPCTTAFIHLPYMPMPIHSRLKLCPRRPRQITSSQI